MERLLSLPSPLEGSEGSVAITKATKAVEQAEEVYKKAVSRSFGMTGTGSGKVGILLPPDIVVRRTQGKGSI